MNDSKLEDKNLIVIVGPTAVGKTEMSIQWAEQFSGEIVSADSRLFYRGMDIGTAKPSLAEQKRICHHLIDVANPRETWSLALFQRAALQSINDIHERQALPFLVGGTGQYIRAVTEGWDLPPQKPDSQFRIVMEEWGKKVGCFSLHKGLACLDEPAARTIDPRNMRRTIRALEVIFRTGVRFSEQRRKSKPPYRCFVIGLTRPRAELYDRIDARIELMLQNGFIDEVQTLLDNGCTLQMPSMSAIGYRQIADYLLGRVTLEEAVTLIKRQTRAFVRRQSAWFRINDVNIHWFNVGEDTVQEVGRLIENL